MPREERKEGDMHDYLNKQVEQFLERQTKMAHPKSGFRRVERKHLNIKKLPWDAEGSTRGQLSFFLADVFKYQDTNKVFKVFCAKPVEDKFLAATMWQKSIQS